MRIKMPAVRIAQADADMPQHQDVLTCGVCQKPFVLGDIVKFIQHKVLACNKENYGCHEGGNGQDSGESDDGVGVMSARRPSISAPMKKGGVRLGCSPPPREEDPRCSTPKRRPAPAPEAASPPTPIKHHDHVDLKPIKQEVDSTPPHSSPEEGPCKKLRIDMTDATSNTTNSEPSNYVCSTCKARLHSAWRLVQHVQNNHGIKIYLDCSPPGSTSSSGSSPGASSSGGKNANNHSASSSCSTTSTSSGCSGNPNGSSTTPVSLPPRLGLHHPPTSSPLVEPHLPLHNPFTVGGLLRLPLEPPRHHQFGPATPASIFARPSSHHEHHFRSMEQLVTEQFRLTQHHGLGLAAAVAAAGGVPPPHSLFAPPPPSDRPSPVVTTASSQRSSVPPPPTLPLSLEPQLDFYSQRLRQLAGTTSPGAANGSSSPSPRKLTPPFTSPNNSIQAPVGLPPSLAVGNGNNNNNNSTTSNNNNITNHNNNNSCSTNNNDGSPPPRLDSSTPPEKQTQVEMVVGDSVDLTSTPRSSSTPPDISKPTDFSVNANLINSDCGENRIHSCEYCGKKFRFQSNLVVHRRTHTGEKPFKCSVCNHACSQSSKLKRHMKVHRRKRATTSTTEEGTGSADTTPDQMSNEGSVETLEDCEEEEEEDMEEDEEEEEEEDEDEEEMELEEEGEGDEDDDLGGDAPEDLTTKSTSSTPPTSTQTRGIGSPKPHPLSSSGSLVGELMDKFGLSNIQQYSEAYKQALQESVGGHNLHITRKDDLQRSPLIPDNNNGGSKLSPPSSRLENGLLDKNAALRFREEFAKNLMAGQPPMDLVGGPHGIFGPGAPFENPFDASKRLKLESKEGHPLGRGPGDRDGVYAGLWLPAMAAAHHREHLFGTNGSDAHHDILASMKEKSLKNGPNPGTSSSLAAAAAAAALNLGLPGQNLKKESRRNDTCEYCGKVFKNCSNLTVHRRSHTGEKPYKCELCSYACAQSSKLTRHMKTHGRMGKDVYRCRFCEMPFSVPSTLEKHMRKCVVNQNIKAEHILPAIISGDEDSAASASKDNT